MSPSEVTKSPEDVFFCPACGQKHRGDLSSLRGPDAGSRGPLRAPCAGCGRQLAVEWKDGKASVTAGGMGKKTASVPATSPAAGMHTAEVKTVPVAAAPVAPVAPVPVPATPVAAVPVAPSAPAAPPPPPPPPKPAAPVPSSRKAEAPTPSSKKDDEERGATSKKEERAAKAAKAAKKEERGSRKKDDRGLKAKVGGGPKDGAKPASEAEAAEPLEEEIQAEFPPGTRVGRYNLETAIGAGGTGTVYRAFDATTNRYVALKMLGKDQPDTMRERFLREIEVQANLRHPNLMPVFDRGEFEGRPYFTMELLYRPFTLTQIVEMAQRGTLSRYTTLRPLEDVATLVREVFLPVCGAMQVANVENGVVHRDLKPDNVLVDSRTLRAYVIDFGICHVLKQSRVSTTVVAPTAEDAGIVGTPRFLAPEQARGTPHERTDVWGLGAILHFILSGEPPIAPAAPIVRKELDRRISALRAAQEAASAAGDDRKADLCFEKLSRLEDDGLRTLDDLYRDAREGVYSPLPASAPAELVAVAKKAMAPKTYDRYANPHQLAGDVEAWLGGTKARAAKVGGAVQGVDPRVAKRRVVARVALVVGGVVLGLLAAPFLPGRGVADADARMESAHSELGALDVEIETLKGRTTSMTPDEQARAYDLLDVQMSRLKGRLSPVSASTAGMDALTQRIRTTSDRFAPPRTFLKFAGAGRLEDVTRGKPPIDVKATPADGPSLELAPGEYLLTVGGKLRAPVRVPLVIRDAGVQADREPPLVRVVIAADPEKAPEGMTFVPGSEGVQHRGPPFAEESPVPVTVKGFWVDRGEVTNGEYVKFLEGIKDEVERAKRVPSVGFAPNDDDGKHFHVLLAAGVRGVTAAEGPDLPVVGVSGDDATAFCKWRSARDKATVRLPTEAEWALLAGVNFGYLLPCGAKGKPSEGDFGPVLLPALKAKRVDKDGRPADLTRFDLWPFGIEGLLGNARELVTPLREQGEFGDTGYFAKGGGYGDEPAEAAIYRMRRLVRSEKDPKTGFRCVREYP
jgi:serine/threonine-protein kinase